MKIILKKDVQGLGYKDDVLTVKDGYGRNYLLPQGLAVLATEKAQKQLAEELKQRAHKIAKIKADAETAAARYEGVALTIEAKVSDGKNIYGSVGPAQIAEALAAKGIEVDQKLINFKSVKALGSYVATVQLHKEVAVEVPFNVVSDGSYVEETPAPAPASEPAPAAAADVDDFDEEDLEVVTEA
jgi:large subunit ribosomal protein L9